MKTKHTKEYAEKLYLKQLEDFKGVGFTEGYMKAIEETNVSELLEALIKLYNAIDSCIDLTPELLIKCNNAIKKATE